MVLVGKNIVICLDGTGNQLKAKGNTNVVRLYEMLDLNEPTLRARAGTSELCQKETFPCRLPVKHFPEPPVSPSASRDDRAAAPGPQDLAVRWT